MVYHSQDIRIAVYCKYSSFSVKFWYVFVLLEIPRPKTTCPLFAGAVPPAVPASWQWWGDSEGRRTGCSGAGGQTSGELNCLLVVVQFKIFYNSDTIREYFSNQFVVQIIEFPAMTHGFLGRWYNIHSNNFNLKFTLYFIYRHMSTCYVMLY